MFSGGIKRDHWHEMGYENVSEYLNMKMSLNIKMPHVAT